MTKKLTPKKTLKLLEDIVKGRENYIYSSGRVDEDEYGEESEDGNCYYANEDGSPSCIVGHVLSRFDPNLFTQVVELEQSIIIGIVDVSKNIPDFPVTVEALRVLKMVQDSQDNGAQWGSALAVARDETEY